MNNARTGQVQPEQDVTSSMLQLVDLTIQCQRLHPCSRAGTLQYGHQHRDCAAAERGSGERPTVMRSAASDDSLHTQKAASRATDASLHTRAPAGSSKPASLGANQQQSDASDTSQSPFQHALAGKQPTPNGIQRNLLAPYQDGSWKGQAVRGQGQALQALPEGTAFQVQSHGSSTIWGHEECSHCSCTPLTVDVHLARFALGGCVMSEQRAALLVTRPSSFCCRSSLLRC